jgi:hypothetical protein
MDFSLDSHEILPYVRVYPNLFPDIEEMKSILYEHERTTTEDPESPHFFEPYRPWYTFGRVTDVQRTPDEFSHEYIRKQKYFHERVKQVREAVIADYCDKYKVFDFINTETWVQQSVNVAEYFDGASVPDPQIHGLNISLKPKAMNYHTDFEIKKMCEDSDNFVLTCNVYWNDDYKGGEVVFFDSDQLLPYKPKQGEVLIFPSGSPFFPQDGQAFYHCANSVFKGKKYFSRNYLQYKHVPTDEMRNAQGDYPTGDRMKGDYHYSSLFNQMMDVSTSNEKKFLVHPIAKRFYKKLDECILVDDFSKTDFFQ